MWEQAFGDISSIAHMSNPERFGVRAYGSNITIESECLPVRLALEKYVFPTFPRMDHSSDQPHVHARVDQAGNQFHLIIGDARVASSASVAGLVTPLMRVIDDTLIERLTRFYAIHAGAVCWDGKALLLPGSSRAGKSSLVAELLRRGATYFSDEYALLDPQGRLHPYPRPLLLRDGSSEQFPALPEEFNAPVGTEPAPVGWILWLQYQPASPWSVARVPQSEALLALLRNTPHVLAQSPEMMPFLQRAVAGAHCYFGHRGEVGHAADQILRLICAEA